MAIHADGRPRGVGVEVELGGLDLDQITSRLQHVADGEVEGLSHYEAKVLGPCAAYVKQANRDKLIEHRQYIEEFGEDLPEIPNWRWANQKPTHDHSTGHRCTPEGQSLAPPVG